MPERSQRCVLRYHAGAGASKAGRAVPALAQAHVPCDRPLPRCRAAQTGSESEAPEITLLVAPLEWKADATRERVFVVDTGRCVLTFRASTERVRQRWLRALKLEHAMCAHQLASGAQAISARARPDSSSDVTISIPKPMMSPAAHARHKLLWPNQIGDYLLSSVEIGKARPPASSAAADQLGMHKNPPTCVFLSR